MKKLSNKIAEYRKKIDAIDNKLLQLINQRAKIAQLVGKIKSTEGDNLKARPEREAQIYRRLQDNNVGPLPDKAVTIIFRELISSCMSLEKKLVVAYLGPNGTHSETAVRHHFGSGVELNPMASVADTMRAVEIGKADFTVVPVENSLEGAVGSTLDLLLTTSLTACGEVILPIHHHLLTQAKDFSAIKKVFAHPQALGQCRNWLRINLPHAEIVPVSSNSMAAKMAKADKAKIKIEAKTIAAIAGQAAADYYNLPSLAQNIEDGSNNNTRFLVLSKFEVAQSGCDRTSLILSTKNVPGTLHSFLEPFSKAGVSLCKIESRPAPKSFYQNYKKNNSKSIKNSWQKTWEYVFFLDIEGHRQDKKVAKVLAKIGREIPFLKIIGSYPQTPHPVD